MTTRAEVDAAIERLFHWAAMADKAGGTVQETTLRGLVVAIHEPVGVIGIACPDTPALLAFVSLAAAAISRGNTVVCIPSPPHPLSATDLYQVFDTSDLPAGVVNIVTGDREHLVKTLVEHDDVDSVWYFGDAEGSRARSKRARYTISSAPGSAMARRAIGLTRSRAPAPNSSASRFRSKISGRRPGA